MSTVCVRKLATISLGSQFAVKRLINPGRLIVYLSQLMSQFRSFATRAGAEIMSTGHQSSSLPNRSLIKLLNYCIKSSTELSSRHYIDSKFIWLKVTYCFRSHWGNIYSYKENAAICREIYCNVYLFLKIQIDKATVLLIS